MGSGTCGGPVTAQRSVDLFSKPSETGVGSGHPNPYCLRCRWIRDLIPTILPSGDAGVPVTL